MVNFGTAPNDANDVQDLWYALEGIGVTNATGEIDGWSFPQTDFGFQNDVAVSAGGEISTSVGAPGGSKLMGQAISTGQWTLAVRWLDYEGGVVREEGISSNTEPDRWANFSLSPKSPFAEIVVYDDSGTEQTVSMTVHYV